MTDPRNDRWPHDMTDEEWERIQEKWDNLGEHCADDVEFEEGR